MHVKLLFIACLFSLVLSAQDKAPMSSAIEVSGEVKEKRTITLDDIGQQPVYTIGNLVITNHAGEVKGTAKNMKGVRLKDLLGQLPLATDNPKLNSTYYFIMKASDGYTVVFSWNEIFNSPIGEKIYIVTTKDGVALPDMPDRLLLVSTTDLMTGRRFVKGLAEVIVKRVS